MLSVYKIKPLFQRLLRPVLSWVHRLGATANHLTVCAILLSAAIGVLFWLYPSGFMLLVYPLGLFVRMALNALDGMMARTYSMQSRSGEFLNELGDVVSDALIYLPLLKLPGMNVYVLFAFVYLGAINEFAGVLAKAVTGTRRYDGPMGKSDRALLAGLVCIVYFFWWGAHAWVSYVFAIAVFLLVVSTYVRIARALKG